jgi:hypothetical protein
MPVAVMSPQLKREREQAPEKDPLDQIMKGLNIASSVYNIYDRASTAAENKIKAEKLAQQQAQELGMKETETAATLAAKGLKKDASGNIVEDPESSFIKSRLADIDRSKEEMAIKRESLALQRDQLKTLKNQTAFKMMPEDQKIMVEKFAGEKAKLFPIVNQFDQYISQLENPNLSESEKIQIGLQSMKLMNSPTNPDAVGAEEVKRIGSYLNPAPQPFGPKGWAVGVDLAGFTEAVKNTRNRSAGTLEAVTNQIETLMGRLPPTPARPVGPQEKAVQRQAPQGGGLLQNRANAAAMPDFTQMSQQDLEKYLGGK